MISLKSSSGLAFVSATQIPALARSRFTFRRNGISCKPKLDPWLMCSHFSETAKTSVFEPSPFHKYRVARSRSISDQSSKESKFKSAVSEPKENVKARMDEQGENKTGHSKKVEETQQIKSMTVGDAEIKGEIGNVNVKGIDADGEMLFASHEDLMGALWQLESDPLESEGGRIVTYRGSKAAKLMIIGEAPGEMEDKLGKPFVGRAGELLDKIFEYGGFDTENQIYVTNVVKRRPEKNRTPTPTEIQYYKPYLLEEIRQIQPAVIVLAGVVAAQAMLGRVRITKVRGKWYGGGTEPWVMPVFHPAYLLRNPIRKHDMVTDIEEIRRKYMQVVPHDTLNPLKRTT